MRGHWAVPGGRAFAIAVTLGALLGGCSALPVPDLPRRVASAPTGALPTAPDVVGVAYGPDPAHVLDVVRRTTTASSGTIVWIHGGGFTRGGRAELLDGSADAVVEQRRRGFDIVSVDYRLAPTHPFPAARDDIAAAVRWIRDDGAALGLSAERIVLVGHSAGGTLAAMIGTTPGTATEAGPVPRVDAWVSVAGMASFDPVEMARDFPGEWGIDSPAERRSAEPNATIDADDPPGLLIHGDLDVIVTDWHSTTLFTHGQLLGASIEIDRVRTGPSDCRGHAPMCGADLDLLERMLD